MLLLIKIIMISVTETLIIFINIIILLKRNTSQRILKNMRRENRNVSAKYIEVF